MAATDVSIYAHLLRPPKSVAQYDAEARQAELDDLALLEAQDKRAAVGRARQRATQLQALMSGMPGATDEQRVQALRGGAFFDEADALEKGIGERAAKAATTRKTQADADKAAYDLQRQKYEHRIGGLRQFAQPEDARQWLADSVTSGAMTMKEADGLIRMVPREPAAFGKWRDDTIMSLMDAAKQAGYITPDANARLAADTTRRGQDTAAATATANREQQARDAAAGRAVTTRGQDLAAQAGSLQTLADGSLVVVPTRVAPGTSPTITPVTGPDGKPVKGAAKGRGAMSATLQKELIDADDMVQQAQSAETLLKRAVDLNDKAYSGFGAKTRAIVRSNLPGEASRADATIDLDNLIGTQALTSLKAIFGGNPTEGERAILLDLQASADKTPAQRKAILQRGIAAAQRRQKLSGERAKAIRAGTYLSDDGSAIGADPTLDDLLQKYGNP